MCLGGAGDGCRLGETIRRRPALPGPALPRRPSVCCPGSPRPWYVRVLGWTGVVAHYVLFLGHAWHEKLLRGQTGSAARVEGQLLPSGTTIDGLQLNCRSIVYFVHPCPRINVQGIVDNVLGGKRVSCLLVKPTCRFLILPSPTLSTSSLFEAQTQLTNPIVVSPCFIFHNF